MAILLLMIGFSCSSGFGNKLASDRLDIYFDTDNLEPIADSLGSYWTKNNLVGDRKQSIKITKNKTIFEVRLIQSNEFKNDVLSPEELLLLHELKSDLKNKVFKGKSMELYLCDDDFNSKLKVE